jgi:hypoxanthine phosphoribosyltransferase
VTSILEDTGTTIPGTITTMQGNVTDILTDTGTTLDAAVAAVKVDTAAIKLKTDALPTDPADESNVLAQIALVKAKTDKIVEVNKSYTYTNDLTARVAVLTVSATP